MIETVLVLGAIMNCSNITQMMAINDMVLSSRPWTHQSCVPYAYAMAKELKQYGCQFTYVTGWNNPPKTIGRGWHRWIETPYFKQIDQNGVLVYTLYDAKYKIDN